MTFNELFEHIYSGSGSQEREDALTGEDRLAWKVIKFFDGRGGFDHWWGGIDEETQDEIFDELRQLIRDEQKGSA